MLAIINFFLSLGRKAVSFFSGIPGKIAVLVAGISAVVGECVSFVDSLSLFFSEKFSALDQYFSGFSQFASNSQLFSLFSYCLALDSLVGILSDVVAFVLLVLTFIFVSFVHVVLIFFGLRYGYHCYKFLLKSFSNGLSHA